MIQIDWQPDRKKLRQFGLTMLVGLGILGLLWAWFEGGWTRVGSWTISLVLWGVGASLGLLAWVAPKLVRPFYLIWMGLAFPLGWVMSHLFLGAVFFLLFLPVGLVFRLVGRDPLRRKKPECESFWIERESQPEAKRYFRQF